MPSGQGDVEFEGAAMSRNTNHHRLSPDIWRQQRLPACPAPGDRACIGVYQPGPQQPPSFQEPCLLEVWQPQWQPPCLLQARSARARGAWRHDIRINGAGSSGRHR